MLKPVNANTTPMYQEGADSNRGGVCIVHTKTAHVKAEVIDD
jgi:hypothetical protein